MSECTCVRACVRVVFAGVSSNSSSSYWPETAGEARGWGGIGCGGSGGELLGGSGGELLGYLLERTPCVQKRRIKIPGSSALCMRTRCITELLQRALPAHELNVVVLHYCITALLLR